jgi:hypothetical protein
MAFVQKLFTSYQGYDDGDSRIGEINRIWYDSNTNTLRISDGETEGGIVIGGGSGGGSYTLPVATTTRLGGVKIGANITITNGVISVADPFSGSYTDLTNKPSIPAAQVNSDWNASSGLAQILNKPVLFSGSYNDLTDTPTIPAAQIQADWNESDNTKLDYIKNKPNLTIPQIKLPFSYGDLAVSPIGSVPAGSIIKEVCIILLNSFDAISTLSVGTSTNPTELLDTTDVTTIATGTYTTEPAHKYTTNTDLVLTITAGASTQGNGIVIIYYE